MGTELIDNPVITVIAKRVNKTPAQVLLAWAVQRGTAPVPTATNARYIEENFGISALPDNAIEVDHSWDQHASQAQYGC